MQKFSQIKEEREQKRENKREKNVKGTLHNVLYPEHICLWNDRMVTGGAHRYLGTQHPTEKSATSWSS